MALFSALALAQSAWAATIAIDVGHSLLKPGATSARGRVEFEFNRDLALQLAEALAERGHVAQLINLHGELNGLAERPRLARNSALFVSLHHDSMQAHFLAPWDWDGQRQRYGDRYAGHSLFVSRETPRLAQSLACASSIGQELRAAGFVPTRHHAEAIPGENRPWADEENAVHYFDHLAVLRRATVPALLFEAGVIVNRQEELLLRNPIRQRRMADRIASGIDRCLGGR